VVNTSELKFKLATPLDAVPITVCEYPPGPVMVTVMEALEPVMTIPRLVSTETITVPRFPPAAIVVGTPANATSDATGAVAVPLSVTVAAATLLAVGVTVSDPVKLPSAVGRNSMPRMQSAPDAITLDEVQVVLLPARLKLVEAVTALRPSATLPLLLNVTSIAGDDTPSA
jgi:hypothetical protein